MGAHTTQAPKVAAEDEIAIEVKDGPLNPIRVDLAGNWEMDGTSRKGSTFDLVANGVYRLRRM